MVTSWRKLWAHDFPFGFVQLAGYAGSKQQTVAQLRRQQLAASGQEGVFFAVAMDLAAPAVAADLTVIPSTRRFKLCRSSHAAASITRDISRAQPHTAISMIEYSSPIM